MTQSVDNPDSPGAEWRYRLTPVQRYCNPPLRMMVVLLPLWGIVELFRILWVIKVDPLSIFILITIAILGLVARLCLGASYYPSGYTTDRELRVVIKDNLFCWGMEGNLWELQPNMIYHVSILGVCGCRMIHTVHGHVLVVPKAVVRSKEFRAFMKQKNVSC